MTAPTNTPGQLLIAGVPWPVYKLVALTLGVLVFALVGVVTMTVATAVVSGAAATTVAWLGLALAQRSNR